MLSRLGSAVAVCSFLGGLAYLRHTQSSLVLEPRVKHPAAPALSPDAVIAIGDLHGDLEQGKTALRLAGLINVYVYLFALCMRFFFDLANRILYESV